MSDTQNPEGKYKSKSIGTSVKYGIIFSSWLFLCLLSFYLGLGLVDENDKWKLVHFEESQVIDKELNYKQAHLGEGEKRLAGNLLEWFFGKTHIEKNQTAPNPTNATPVENKSSNLERQTNIQKPIRASTWFSDYEAMKQVVHLYDEIHPFIYSMKGGLSNNGELANTWSSTQKKERIEELRRLNPNVKIIPTIFRWENPKEKIVENIGMNGRTDIRDKHIQAILYEIDTYGYDGIDIDYEGMGCEKKEKFEEFIALLSKELKKRNKLLSIAVHPKTPLAKPIQTICKGSGKKIIIDYKERWRGPMAHDYEVLAKYADRFKIMAYELHPRKYHNPGPGPQAPNAWLKEIIRYSRKKVPEEKLYMAIPTYGYDWALDCKIPAKSVYYSDVLRIQTMNPKVYQPTNITEILAQNPNKPWVNLRKFAWVHENKIYEDPSLWYTQNGCDRVAFHMNRKAFEEKMNLLRRYNIGGFSFWQLISDNDPGINEYLHLLMTNQAPPVELAYDLEEEYELPSPTPSLHEEKSNIPKNLEQKQKQKSSLEPIALSKPIKEYKKQAPVVPKNEIKITENYENNSNESVQDIDESLTTPW